MYIMVSIIKFCSQYAVSVEHFALFFSPEIGGNTYDRLSSWDSDFKQPKSH